MAINLDALTSAKKVTVNYVDVESIVNGTFVKELRKNNGYTQIRLANILHVTKKAVEKWEQGKNPVSGSSAALLYLLKEKPELADLLLVTNVKSECPQTVDEEELADIYGATEINQKRENSSYNNCLAYSCF